MSEVFIAVITTIFFIQFVGGIMVLANLTPYPDFDELFVFVSMLFGSHYRFTRKLHGYRLNRIGTIIACITYYVFIAPVAIIWLAVALVMDIGRIAFKIFLWIFREREDSDE